MKTIIVCCLMILLYSCKSIDKTKEYECEFSLDDIVYLAYQNRNDYVFFKLCEELNKTIISLDSTFYIQAISSIGPFDESSPFIFEKINESIPPVLEKILFEVFIESDSVIIAEGMPITIGKIRSSAKKYIFYPKEEHKKITTKVIQNNEFGKIEVSKVGALVACSVKKNKGLSVMEWRTFFNVVNELILVYNENREEISMEKWGKKYEDLNMQQKESLSDVAGFPVTLLFDTYGFD